MPSKKPPTKKPTPKKPAGLRIGERAEGAEAELMESYETAIHALIDALDGDDLAAIADAHVALCKLVGRKPRRKREANEDDLKRYG